MTVAHSAFNVYFAWYAVGGLGLLGNSMLMGTVGTHTHKYAFTYTHAQHMYVHIHIHT